MTREMPEGEFGPPIHFREYSLLHNQRAKALNESVLALVVCAVGGGWWVVVVRLGWLGGALLEHLLLMGGSRTPLPHWRPTNLLLSPALAPWDLQDDAQEGCADSGEASGKLRPHLNEQQLTQLLTQGQAAQAKVCACAGGWAGWTARLLADAADAVYAGWYSCPVLVSGGSMDQGAHPLSSPFYPSPPRGPPLP